MKILIMGMGAIGHAYAAQAHPNVVVETLTSTGEKCDYITNTDGIGHEIENNYSYESIEYIDHDYLLVTLPYRQKASRLEQIKNIVSKDTTIVIIPGNQGAYYYIPNELRSNKIILTERVLQISRIVEKNKLVRIFGTRKDMHMSKLNGASIDEFIKLYPVHGTVVQHDAHENISFITSNSTIHTARIYEMYALNQAYDQEFLFYEQWTDIASKYFVDLEKEMFDIAHVIEKQQNIKLDIYDMFTHFKIDPDSYSSATKQISEFSGFKGITFYAKDESDLCTNRYLVDDCILGMAFFIELGRRYNVAVPTFELIHNWAKNLLGEELEELKYMHID